MTFSFLPRFYLFLLLLALSTTSLQAAGTTAADFLNFGVGRAAAMSEASGAIAQDVSALYWNPAGMAALDSADVYISHNSLPFTLRNDFAGVAVPFGSQDLKGAVGYTLQALTQSAIDSVDDNGNPAGTFTSVDMAHTLGLAFRYNDMRFGISGRYISQSLDGTSGSAIAGNAGIQKDFGDRWLCGASITNVGQDLKLGTEGFPLPRTERAGAGLKLLDGDMLLAGDISDQLGLGVRGHVGVDYRIYPPREANSAFQQAGGLSVRTGYTIGNSKQDALSGATWGLGFLIRSWRADFSYQPYGDLGNSYQFGVGYRF